MWVVVVAVDAVEDVAHAIEHLESDQEHTEESEDKVRPQRPPCPIFGTLTSDSPQGKGCLHIQWKCSKGSGAGLSMASVHDVRFTCPDVGVLKQEQADEQRAVQAKNFYWLSYLGYCTAAEMQSNSVSVLECRREYFFESPMSCRTWKGCLLS